MSSTLFIKRLTPTAILPTRADPGSIGYDLYADEGVEITWGYRGNVKTGISLTVPEGCYGRIAPRSKWANEFGIDTLAGVIDRSYTGEIIVILQNHGGGPFQVKRGMRIAQLILERAETPVIEEVQELAQTSRGEGGFGSTGVV